MPAVIENRTIGAKKIPILPKGDFTNRLLRQAVSLLHAASQTIEHLRFLMNETALPEYPVVIAMKGIGPSLGPQLMGETRFTHRGAITAFAGVDPGVNGSGDGSLAITVIRLAPGGIVQLGWTHCRLKGIRVALFPP